MHYSWDNLVTASKVHEGEFKPSVSVIYSATSKSAARVQHKCDTNRVRKWRGKCHGNKRASQQEGSKTKGKECGTTIEGTRHTGRQTIEEQYIWVLTAPI